MWSKLWYFVIFIITLSINTIIVTKENAVGKNNGFIQRKLDLDKIDTPKNIFVGSAVGGGSHLNPILEVCKILLDRGYKVNLVAPGNFTAKSTLYHSIPQIITGEPFDTYASPEYRKIFFNEFTFKSLADEQMMFNQRYIEYFNKYLQAYKETKPDLFICDYVGNEACFDLAWKLKKPVVGFVSNTEFFTAPPPFRSDPMMGCHVNMENESFYDRFICAVVQPLRLGWHFRKILNYLNARRAEVGVSEHYDIRGRIVNTLFLVNSFFGFELPSAWPPIHQEIGPILPDTFPDLSSDLNLFLSAHPRTMYIALGSFVYTTPKNYAILLQSVLELINSNIIDGVIWATVRFNESELPSTFTLSTGDIISTLNILNNLYPHIHVTKYAPQFAILSHKNTKIFLSHGGASSSHESMYTATPMLVLPIAFDQPGNAEKLELTGMALKLSKIDLKVEDIVSKVIRIMSEESFKMNAERMQVLLKFNSKRKYRGVDLIEIVMNFAKRDGIRNENDELEVDNEVLLRNWITPDSRMGFIRGNYLDVFSVAIIISLVLFSSLVYGFYVIMFAFKKWALRNRNSQSKPKNE
ncbi:6593_t:CDS:2 [Scutellospora calospora]|uniref:6593_t:CDS:1 n=1 Tax=Scutellospora calospora TaxID=85575 RepID=A0ACA9JU70_9GLOM|nr:6593_t:CDS:2 [Scutellospora calospora]